MKEVKLKMAKENEAIRYRDLSGPLKAIVIISWIVGSVCALSFLAGFFSAFAY